MDTKIVAVDLPNSCEECRFRGEETTAGGIFGWKCILEPEIFTTNDGTVDSSCPLIDFEAAFDDMMFYRSNPSLK